MPNWCDNSTIISNATPAQIERIVTAAESGRFFQEFMPEPDWRSTPNENGVFPSPAYSDWTGRPWQRRGCFNFPCSVFPDNSADQRWYGWRTDDQNWGTKWEADFQNIDASSGDVCLSYCTAWSPPSKCFINAMAIALPGCHIINTYQEPGNDFYGQTETVSSEVVDCSISIMDVRDKWIEERFDAETRAKLENDDSETEDLVNDEWYEVESDILEEALALELKTSL